MFYREHKSCLLLLKAPSCKYQGGAFYFGKNHKIIQLFPQITDETGKSIYKRYDSDYKRHIYHIMSNLY
jgi:hypothetical protein